MLSSRLGRIGRIGTLLLFAAAFGYPLLAFLAVAFRRDDGRGSSGPGLGNAVANWEAVLAFNDGAFLGWLTNSVIVASIGSLIAVIAALPAGYALARPRFRGRRLLRSPPASTA